MRALVCREFGPPEALEAGELPEPEAKADEVLIQVEAAAASFADSLMIRDLHQTNTRCPSPRGWKLQAKSSAWARMLAV